MQENQKLAAIDKCRFGALPKVPGCNMHKHRKFRMVVQREAEVFECLKCNLNPGILHEWRHTLQRSRDAVVDLGTMKSYAQRANKLNDGFDAEATKSWRVEGRPRAPSV